MKSNKSCYLLVAEGFDEESVAQTAEFFRLSRVKLTILSLYFSPKTEALATKYGFSSFRNLLLSDVENRELPNGLLVAGGTVCGQHLMIDPRFHRLARAMWQVSRPVGFLYPTYIPLLELSHRLPSSTTNLFQERLQKETFLNNFIFQIFAALPVYEAQSVPLLL